MEVEKLQRKNTWAETSMTPILTEYGMPEKQKKKKKKKFEFVEPKKEKKREDTFLSSYSDERDAERKKIRDEHNMQVYEDVHKLKQYYYEQYMGLLNEKVEKQRKQIQKKSFEMENRIHVKELKEKEESHKVKRRLQRIDVKHDDQFLKRLPKSSFYKIVAIQDQLIASGQLKSQSDIDDFWLMAQSPGGLEALLPPSSKTGTDEDNGSNSVTRSYVSTPPSQNAASLSGVEMRRPMTQIEETREPSRPVTRDQDWAVTQQVHHQNRRPVSHKQLDAHTIARHAAIALDKKYPQLALPNMYCFTLDLEDKPPDPEEVLKEREAFRREAERKAFVSKLRKMYQLSVSNAASTKRILGQKEETEIDPKDGLSVADITLANELLAGKNDTVSDEDMGDEVPSWMRYIGRGRTIAPIQEEEEVSTEKASTNEPQARSDRATSSSKRPRKLTVTSPPPPLDMDTVMKNKKIVEARCLSTFWTNYAKDSQMVQHDPES